MGEEMQGMAAMGMTPTGSRFTVAQVVEAIMQGVNPEELLAMGVPQEVIDKAMAKLMEQTQPPMQEGLAGMQVPMEM